MIKQILRRLRGDALRTTFEDETLRIAQLGNPSGDTVVLCFTGVGLGMGGVQTEEFVGISSKTGGSAIFVTDKLRSWFNAVPPEILCKQLEPLIGGRRVVTLGNSMGAFGAIWASKFLDVDTAIAFAPQFSVHPEIVPKEDRWRAWRDEITTWHYPDLTAHFVPRTRYFTFNGTEDEEHWQHFHSSDAQTHVLVPEAGHDVAKVLKDHDALGQVIADCVAADDPISRIRSAGLDCRLIA